MYVIFQYMISVKVFKCLFSESLNCYIIDFDSSLSAQLLALNGVLSNLSSLPFHVKFCRAECTLTQQWESFFLKRSFWSFAFFDVRLLQKMKGRVVHRWHSKARLVETKSKLWIMKYILLNILFNFSSVSKTIWPIYNAAFHSFSNRLHLEKKYFVDVSLKWGQCLK